MNRRSCMRLAALLAAAWATGCAPQAGGRLPLAPGVSNGALFGCAESVLRNPHRANSQWNTRVTTRDVGGHFETGDFPESNVMRYRVRLVRRHGAPRASLHVRAAGSYFTDLGADAALGTFGNSLTACLAHAPPPR